MIYKPNYAVRWSDHNGTQYTVVCLADSPVEAAKAATQYVNTFRDVEVWSLSDPVWLRRGDFLEWREPPKES